MNLLENNFTRTARTHWPALVVATLVGLMCVAPHLYFALKNPSYAGVALIGSDGEGHYAARINQVYAGHPALGNTFLPHKSQPYFQPALGEIIVAGIGKLGGMSAATVNTFSKFLFPFLVSLLIYAFAYALFSSRVISIFAVLCALFGDNLVSGPGPWLALLHGVSTSTDFLPYVRPINPEVSGLFLFLALYIFYRAFAVRGRPRVWESVLVGVLTGASLYMTPYTATFLVVFLALSFVWFVRQRLFNNALHIVYTGAASFVAVIPFLVNYKALVADPNYHDTAMRYGLIMSHAPSFGLWLFIMLGLSVLLWPKQYQNARIFFGIAAVALLILTNQQVVTGHALQLGHYHWYVAKPLVGILLAMYFVVLLQYFVANTRVRAVVYTLAALVLCYNATLVQAYSYHMHVGDEVIAQAYAPTLAYLRTLPKEETVWADKPVSTNISLYTRHNTPNNDYTASYLVSNDYLVERMLLEYRLGGITPANIRAQLEKDRAVVSGQIFQLYWRDHAGGYAAIPDSYLDEYANEYTSIYSKPLKTLFSDLGVTMIVWDKAAEPMWHIDSLPFAHQVFTDNRLFVYQLD